MSILEGIAYLIVVAFGALGVYLANRRPPIKCSRIITGNDPLALKMCNALGLKDARWFEIRMAAGEIGILRSECFLRVDTAERIIPILKKYEMRPKNEREVAP